MYLDCNKYNIEVLFYCTLVICLVMLLMVNNTELFILHDCVYKGDQSNCSKLLLLAIVIVI